MNSQKLSNKRFGTVAAEKDFVTSEQVTEALRIQVDENMNQGIHRQIGAILFDMGLMDAGQIQMVLGELSSASKLAV